MRDWIATKEKMKLVNKQISEYLPSALKDSQAMELPEVADFRW